MNKSALLLSSAALAALIGATAVTPSANGAAVPSTPEEQAATAELNRKIADANAAEEARAKAQQQQYEDTLKKQKADYEAAIKAWEKQKQDLIDKQIQPIVPAPP